MAVAPSFVHKIAPSLSTKSFSLLLGPSSDANDELTAKHATMFDDVVITDADQANRNGEHVTG